MALNTFILPLVSTCGIRPETFRTVKQQQKSTCNIARFMFLQKFKSNTTYSSDLKMSG